MDKFSELKRRADKCPIKRFKAFIGRANTQATLCADTGIEIIGWSGFDASDLSAKSHRVELARFIAAADPETILSLLADNEHLARELVARNGENEWLRKRAAELEAKDKRITELERANKAQDDHINQQQDRIDSLEKTNAGFGRSLAAAENQMATPVRLPEGTGWASDPYNQGRNKGIHQCADAILAAGFTVEGDE